MSLRLVSFYVFAATYVAASTLKIFTPSGEIEGSTQLTTRLGRRIYAFRGIRYAEAKRFQRPVPTGPWEGTYNATVDGPICPQPPLQSLPISEDCLFLNVYTTKLPDRTRSVQLPVIVHIHGGSYVTGAGHSAVTSPKYLLDEDVVLVTFNYRLGALGFMAINEEVPGNDGIIDQVVVLEWVQNHIGAFGGDPNSVTIFGFSAGACSVSLHLVSEMSRNLFHKAILESCAVYHYEPARNLQIELAQRQARVVGCVDHPPEALLACLRSRPAEKIANTLSQLFEFGQHPIMAWLPVLEEDFGQRRFVTEHPATSILHGRFAKVPVMAGVTRDEVAVRAIDIVKDPALLKQLNDDFYTWGPVVFFYERNSTRSKEISDLIRQFYFHNESITQAKLTQLGEVFADSSIGSGVNRAVNIISENNRNHVYYYEFTYDKTNKPFGVYHGVDQQYLFPSSVDPAPSEEEEELIEMMTTFLSNFARTGNPNKPTKATNIIWEQYNVYSRMYLDIGKNLTMRDHLFKDRYNFWDNVYPLSLYLQ